MSSKALPERVQSLLARRANAVHARQIAYRHCQDEICPDEILDLQIQQQRSLEQHLSCGRDQGLDCGLEL